MSVNVGGKQYLLGLYDTAGQVQLTLYCQGHTLTCTLSVSLSLYLAPPHPHVAPQSSNTPTGFTFRPDAKLQQVMAFAHGFTARVWCSMDSGGSEGVSILLLCGEQGSYVQ